MQIQTKLLAIFLFTFGALLNICVTCPIEDDPTNLARCIQIDITAIVYAARGKDDITSLCALADRYMECIKTYTRGCVGYYFADGSLTELQNIALYCCKGTETSTSCPFNSKVKKCFDGQATTLTASGEKKLIKDLAVGDKVKTLDTNGNLKDTEVIMMMDKSSEQSLFLNIRTSTNKSLSVSATHLIAVPGGQYKFAKKLFKDDVIVMYDSVSNQQIEEKVESVLIEPVESYAAPLTADGTLLVNDMLASCYAVIESHSIAHAVMAPVRWWHSLNEGISYIVGNEIAPLKNDGTHWYPELLFSFTNTYLKQFVKLY